MDCPFCDTASLQDRVISETKNFIFIAGRGQLVEGYSLIIPKLHARCYAELPVELLEEYISFKSLVDKAMAVAYMAPIYFEHGIVGQTIYHAHMHCTPTGADFLHRLWQQFPAREKILSETELPKLFAEYGPYFFYDCRGKYVFDVNTDEPDSFKAAMRVALADELGFPEAADWRNVNEKDDMKSMQRTVEKLKPFFK